MFLLHTKLIYKLKILKILTDGDKTRFEEFLNILIRNFKTNSKKKISISLIIVEELKLDNSINFSDVEFLFKSGIDDISQSLSYYQDTMRLIINKWAGANELEETKSQSSDNSNNTVKESSLSLCFEDMRKCLNINLSIDIFDMLVSSKDFKINFQYYKESLVGFIISVYWTRSSTTYDDIKDNKLIYNEFSSTIKGNPFIKHLNQTISPSSKLIVKSFRTFSDPKDVSNKEWLYISKLDSICIIDWKCANSDLVSSNLFDILWKGITLLLENYCCANESTIEGFLSTFDDSKCFYTKKGYLYKEVIFKSDHIWTKMRENAHEKATILQILSDVYFLK